MAETHLSGCWDTRTWMLLSAITLLITTTECSVYNQQPTVLTAIDHNIFKDPSSGYFRYYQADSDYLYIGGADYIYRLEWSDISKFKRSVSLKVTATDEDYCLVVRERTTEFHCRNHIRSILIHDGRMHVCGTGAFYPIEYVMNVDSLTVNETGADRAATSTYCHEDPQSLGTSILVTSGTPMNLPAVSYYGSKQYIFRPQLAEDLPFVRTDNRDKAWLNDAEFVASLDYRDYVYFFFRELALEREFLQPEIAGRVARVCKADLGGAMTLSKMWTSYQKARLNCSTGVGEGDIYFNDLRDVKMMAGEVYGLFTVFSNGVQASAICKFTMEQIEKSFNGSFLQRKSSQAKWTVTPDHDVPTPRPGQCVNDSRELSDAHLQFVQHRQLMAEAVQSDGGRPVYVARGVLYDRMEVVAPALDDHTVFFLATVEGDVWKVVHHSITHRSRVVVEWRLADAAKPVYWLTHRGGWLYVGQDHQVGQYSIYQCESYAACTECVQDPNCGWNAVQHSCTHFRASGDANLLQDVFGNNPFKFCASACRVDAASVVTIKSASESVLLSCHTSCSTNASIQPLWEVYGEEQDSYRQISVQDKRDKALGAWSYRAHNGGLVLADLSKTLRLRCQIEGVTVSEHQVQVAAAATASTTKPPATTDTSENTSGNSSESSCGSGAVGPAKQTDSARSFPAVVYVMAAVIVLGTLIPLMAVVASKLRRRYNEGGGFGKRKHTEPTRYPSSADSTLGMKEASFVDPNITPIEIT